MKTSLTGRLGLNRFGLVGSCSRLDCFFFLRIDWVLNGFWAKHFISGFRPAEWVYIYIYSGLMSFGPIGLAVNHGLNKSKWTINNFGLPEFYMSTHESSGLRKLWVSWAIRRKAWLKCLINKLQIQEMREKM